MPADDETTCCTTDDLWGMTHAFLGWLDEAGYASYDPYDIWGTPYGLASRRIYYRNHVLGLPLIAPILLLDTFFPKGRALFVKKQRYATADAQLLLGFLNLYTVSREALYLEKARSLAQDLLATSIPGYSGHCWGYPFDWQHNQGMWRKNTPYITCTPYCYEAFLGLYEKTGEAQYRDVAVSIARFVHDDLNGTRTSETASAGSYSPLDHTQVINASAYRAFVLLDSAARLGCTDYRSEGLRNLNFVLESQGEDGSWLYGLCSPKNRFIDHFHTCFVLKNLHKVSGIVEGEAVSSAIRRGYAYYLENLFTPEGDPKPFAVTPRAQVVKLKMYDFAEAITLGVALREWFPASLELATRLAQRVRDTGRTPKGYFVTRVYRGGLKSRMPFLRWPQAQMFFALSNLLGAVNSPSPGEGCQGTTGCS